MADYQDFVPFYEDDAISEDKNTNVTDLHAYFMTQFNMELENKNKSNKTTKANDLFNKNGHEESFNLENLDGWTQNEDQTGYAFEIIDAVIENKNVSEENIKDVLLDLDSINTQHKPTVGNNVKVAESKVYNSSNDYIDDESLIDELCREDTDCRLTPDIFNDEYLSSISNEKNHLPSMETAFSKRFFNYNNDQGNCATQNSETVVQNLDCYSYPNNILHNLNSESGYILPDTPTSCSEFSYERAERKVSVSESIESDVQSSFYDGNSETYDEEELFVNLDDFGFVSFDAESVGGCNNGFEAVKERRSDKDKAQGERSCLWEHCYERYPNQSTLVEHIERSHVNTYKGDEFSCLWRECARARRPFNARYKLLIHMRVHSGHKPNRCHHPGCGKAFSRLENLKIHMRSHTGERPYACPAPHCRKAFSNSSDRAKHQRTHFNARPYACGAVGCGKRYTDPSSLRKHVKSHPHVTSVPRTCLPASRPARKLELDGKLRSPVKLATLRCIRDKLATGPRFQRL